MWKSFSYPHRWQGGGNTFTQKKIYLKIPKQHTISLISTLKLTKLFYNKNVCFIQNFTYMGKGVKCRSKKNYLPEVFESTISKPQFISYYYSTRSYLARAEKYLDESRFGKQYFPTLG